jgi:hypothetical protein
MVKQRSWQLPAISLALYACFWATASVAGWFADRPFLYQTRQNWVSDLSLSATRWLPPAETLLTGAALVFLLPSIVVAAIYLSRRYDWDPFDRWFERADAERAVVVISVAIAVAVAMFVAFALIRGAAILDDERAYLWQAHLFAHGHVGLPTPPDALGNPLILRSPMWTSGYPPGQSLVLAPATLIHAEHVLPPVFAGVLVVAVWSFSRDMFGPKHAALAAMLTSLSPFVWAIHGTVLAFGTSVTCLAVFLAAIARAERTGRARWTGLAGIVIGIAFITRPYEAVAFAFPFALRLIWDARREPARLIWCVVGFLSIAWLLPVHDALVTGSPFEMPYNSPAMPSFRLGFYIKSMMFGSHVHTPAHAIGNLVGVILRLDLWALAWPGSLLLVLAGVLRRKPTRGDEMLRIGLAGYVVFYLIVPYPGTWDVGPTYYYAIVPLLIPLAVRGVSSLRVRTATLAPTAPRAISWLVLCGLAVATTAIAPIRAIHITELASQILSPWELIESSDLGPSIVLVPGSLLRKAPGWAFGHPYTLTSRTGGLVQLIIPEDQHALDEAVKFLGPKPVYVLQLDADHFAKTGDRVFSLEPAQTK